MRNFMTFPALNHNNALTTTKLHSFCKLRLSKFPKLLPFSLGNLRRQGVLTLVGITVVINSNFGRTFANRKHKHTNMAKDRNLSRDRIDFGHSKIGPLFRALFSRH